MSGPRSAKDLLRDYNQEQYKKFVLEGNEKTNLLLPQVSSVPGVGASKRPKISYTKQTFSEAPGLEFITKNEKPHTFVWKTSSAKLKEAVRWGIVETHSITSKVISKLGQYRVLAHERIARGMISNSQPLKLALLDLFQDRFEALQALELLVNRENSEKDYTDKLGVYIENLTAIKAKLTDYFSKISVNTVVADEGMISQIESDIDIDIEKAKQYQKAIDASTLRANNRAKGTASIQEFVKQQMLSGLYALQGINQDLSYRKKRAFALTRGELNDCIEDARKDLDDHQADLRDAVTEQHHGIYEEEQDKKLTYDFRHDHLSSARSREVLLAISFIEKWDTLDETNPLALKNQTGTEDLDVIHATRWKRYRNVTGLVKGVAHYLWNVVKSIFVPTRPWEVSSWKNKSFKLVASTLRAQAAPNEPMLLRPIRFLKQIGHAVIDLFSGIYDFGSHLVLEMPEDLVNDWESTLPEEQTLEAILKNANDAFAVIKKEEDENLHKILKGCNHGSPVQSASTSSFAQVDYPLTAGEQNDILTAATRGLSEFSSFFTHNIYAKDPIAGLCFTTAYAVGAAAIYAPSMAAHLFGKGYVSWFSKAGYSMGSSKLAATVGGASTQAQLAALSSDLISHGPSGMMMNALYQLGEDPVTVAAYIAAAHGFGYLLANGVAGHHIPWLTEYLREELGSAPHTSYPFVGGKFAILLWEALMTHAKTHYPQPNLGENTEIDPAQINATDKRLLEQFELVAWLSKHGDTLVQLPRKDLFAISRKIDALFSKEESKSLKKLLHPENEISIAFQLFSIPLSYIPAVLRCLTALVLSVVALCKGRKAYAAPIKRAFGDLGEMIKRDLTRLVVFASQLMYLLYTQAASIVKMFAYIGSMIVGRIASLFDAKPAHAMHRGFAACHAAFRKLGEFLFPTRVVKSAAVAHPTHTMNTVKSSYTRLIKDLKLAEKTATSNKVEPPFMPKDPLFASSANDGVVTSACPGLAFDSRI